jgi:hypothetical protein
VVVFVLLVREWQYTRNLALKLGIASLSFMIMTWLIPIVAYAQSGYYEGVIVLVFFAETCFIAFVYYLYLAFVIPLCTIFRIPSVRIRKILSYSSLCMVGVAFSFAVALLVVVRDVYVYYGLVFSVFLGKFLSGVA